jgi:hypothetical protein
MSSVWREHDFQTLKKPLEWEDMNFPFTVSLQQTASAVDKKKPGVWQEGPRAVFSL